MQTFKRILEGLNRFPLVIGGMAVIALMSLASINVFLRIIQKPYSGTYEIVAFLGAIVTAFALGETQRKKNHIVVDILSDRYPAWLKRIVESIGYFISATFFSIIGWVIFRWGKQIASSGEVSETLKIVYYPFVYLVAIGFLNLAITLFADLLDSIGYRKGGKRS